VCAHQIYMSIDNNSGASCQYLHLGSLGLKYKEVSLSWIGRLGGIWLWTYATPWGLKVKKRGLSWTGWLGGIWLQTYATP
jgi:hypothetical protein